MRGVVEIAHILGVHLEKWSEAGHDVADPSVARLVLVPLPQPLLETRQEKVVVEFEEGFDVGKHLRDEFLGEHGVGSGLLVDPELENLWKNIKKKFYFYRRWVCLSNWQSFPRAHPFSRLFRPETFEIRAEIVYTAPLR